MNRKDNGIRKYATTTLFGMLTSLMVMAQIVNRFDASSIFVGGFARVQSGEESYYVDKNGNRVFDEIIRFGHLFEIGGGSIFRSDNAGPNPIEGVIVRSGDKIGALHPSSGRWILPCIYDDISPTELRHVWMVESDGREWFFSEKGIHNDMPFDDFGYTGYDFFGVKQEGKWGVYHPQTQTLRIPCSYEDLYFFMGDNDNPSYFYAARDGKWGIVDSLNNVVLPFDYELDKEEVATSFWTTALSKDGKRRLIHVKSGRESKWTDLLADEANAISVSPTGFIAVHRQGKSGFFHARGDTILPLVYDSIRYDAGQSIHEPVSPYVHTKLNGHYGVADTAGRELIAPQYDEWVQCYENGWFGGMKDSMLYLLDSTGNKVIEQGFDEIDPIVPKTESFGSLPVYNIKPSSQQGVFDIEPEMAGDERWREMLMFIIKKSNRYGFFSAYHGTYIEPIYRWLRFMEYDNGYLHAHTEDGSVYITLDGRRSLLLEKADFVRSKPIVPSLMETVKYIVADNQDTILASGLFDKDRMVMITDFRYKNIRKLDDDGDFLVVRDVNTGKAGVLDRQGQVVIPIAYTHITMEHHPYLFMLREDGDSSTVEIFNIETQKTFSIKAKGYEYNSTYDDDKLCYVWDDDHVWFWDPSSGRLLPDKMVWDGYKMPLFVPLSVQKPELYLMIRNHKLGLVEPRTGRTVLPFDYQRVWSGVASPNFLVCKNEKWGIIDGEGKEIVPFRYDEFWGERKGSWGTLQHQPIALQQGDVIDFVELSGRLVYQAERIIDFQ